MDDEVVQTGGHLKKLDRLIMKAKIALTDKKHKIRSFSKGVKTASYFCPICDLDCIVNTDGKIITGLAVSETCKGDGTSVYT